MFRHFLEVVHVLHIHVALVMFYSYYMLSQKQKIPRSSLTDFIVAVLNSHESRLCKCLNRPKASTSDRSQEVKILLLNKFRCKWFTCTNKHMDTLGAKVTMLQVQGQSACMPWIHRDSSNAYTHWLTPPHPKIVCQFFHLLQKITCVETIKQRFTPASLQTPNL